MSSSMLLLWTAALAALFAKATPQAIDGCFVDTSCSSPATEGSFTDAESCCIADSPLAYSVGGACTECIVVGWLDTALELVENGQQVNLPFGYAKGTPPPGFLRLAVSHTPGTAELFRDYTPPATTTFTLRANTPPLLVTVSAQGDQVSQEGLETFTVQLARDGGPVIPVGVFLRSTLVVSIIDDTVVTISWTELDYGAPERNAVMNGNIQTSIQLAAPIVITVTPLTYSQAQDRGFTIPTELPPPCSVNDFDPTPLTITIPASTGAINIVAVAITVIDDLRDELDEGFLAVLELSSAEFPNLVAFDATTRVALGRVLDNDDTLIGFEFPSYTYPELATDSQQTIRLIKESLSDITVSVVISVLAETPPNSDAASENDYSLIETIVYEFSPEDDFEDFTFTVLADENVEMLEGVVLRVSGADGSASVLPGTNPTTNVFITDTDELVIGFTQTAYDVSEDIGDALIEVAVLSGELADGVSVDVEFTTTFGGSAADGSDYTAVTRTLTFTSTITSIPVPVRILDDEVYEGPELFITNLNDASLDRVTLNPASAVVNIIDEDEVIIEFDPVSYGVSEGSPGELVLVLRGESAVAVSVDLTTQDGSATAPGDYTTLTQTVTFSPGQASQTVSVATISDQSAEDVEQFTAVLSNPSPGARIGAGVATVTISDDTIVLVELSPLSFSMREDGGVAMFTVTKVTDTTRSITVLFSTVDGTALAGSDYTAVSERRVTFAPGEFMQIVSVMLMDDEVYELSEDFIGRLSLEAGSSGVSIGQDSSVATIEDEDVLVIGFTQEVYDVTEDIGDALITVQVLSGELADGVSVDVEFTTAFGGSAVDGSDYTAVTRTLTFTSTITSIPVPVRILDDDVYEGPELFITSLNDASLDRVTLNPASAVVNIIDEDEVIIEFDPVSYGVSEGSPGELVVVLRGESAVAVSVDLTTQDGSATAPGDYTTLTQTVTFSPGQTSQTVSVATISDQSAEDIEQFTAVLSNPSSGASIGAGVATVTISDDTIVLVELSPLSFSMREDGGVAMFTVTKVTETTRTITVLFSTVDGTALAGSDYTAVSGIDVTFDPNETMQTVFVTILNDEILENDENFVGRLSLPGGATGIMIGQSVSTATIQDEDDVTVEFDPASYNVMEGGVVNFRVVLRGETSVPVDVAFATRDDTAQAPGDYSSVAMTLTFSPGVSELLVPVQTTEDQLAEPVENLIGRLSAVLGSGQRVILGVDQATAAIEDNDDVVIEFEPVVYSVSEGMSAMLTVVLRAPSANTVTVEISTIDGSATSASSDFNQLLSQIVTFAPGVLRQTIPVATLPDQSAESTEQFTAVLRNPSPGVIIGSADTATISIEDTTDVVIELDPLVYQVTEGQDRIVRFRVVKRTPTTRQVEVLFSTVDQSAEAPGDYTARSDVTVTFAPSVTDQEVEVTISNDGVYELLEEFIGQISLPSDSEGVVLGANQATVAISDDDVLVIGFEEQEYTAFEPSSGTRDQEVCIIVTSGQLGETLTIQPEFTQGTALENEDYRSPTNNFILEPGTSRPRACLPVTLFSDEILETTEELTGRLRGVVSDGGMVTENPDRITFEPRDTRVLINDDVNERVTIGFERPSYTTNEPDSGSQMTLEVCMVITGGRLGRSLFVSPRVTPGTAQEGVPSVGGDYIVGDEEFEFSPTMSRSCINLFVFDDPIVERTEDLTVGVEGLRDSPTGPLMSSVAGVTVNPSITTVEIEDNDNIVVGFERVSYTFLEPNPGLSQRTEEVCVLIMSGQISMNSVLTVTPTFLPGTATLNSDYRTPVSREYTFRSGSRSECLDLVILQDTVFEVPEDLSAEISNVLLDGTAILGTDQVTAQPSETMIVIEDTDAITVGFEFTSYDFDEPSSSFQQRQVCMVLEGQASFDLEVEVRWVPISATPGAFGADYNPSMTTYRFSQGVTRQCIDIQIFRDNMFEQDETFSGQLIGVRLPGGTLEPFVTGVTVAPSETLVTIQDMDAVTIGFVNPTYEFSEPPPGSQQQGFPVCIEVSSGSIGTTGGLIVEVEWVAGTAFEGFGEDYIRPLTAYRLLQTERMACVDLTVLNDNLLEDTETLQARLIRVTDSVGNVITSDRLTLDPQIADITILDNDPVEIGFERPSYSISEPGAGGQVTQEVCLVVSRGSIGRELIIVPDFRDGTAERGVPSQGGDYISELGNFIFTPGNNRACLDVFVFQDLVYELTEDLIVQVGGFINPQGNQVPALSGVTVRPDMSTILIMDSNVLTIGFRRERDSFSEPNTGTSQSREEVCVDVTEGVVGTTITIEAVFTPGTATEGNGGDYLEPTAQFTLNPSETSDCIELTILNDDLFEPAENLIGRLTTLIIDGQSFPSLPRVTLQPVQTTIDIVDNDAVTIGFSEPSYTITEPGSGSAVVRVCVELIFGNLGQQVRIVPQFDDITAIEGVVSTGGDYALPEESNFILNPGDIMSCLDVLVLSDNLFESDEMFNVRLVGLIDDRGFPVDSIDGVTLNPDLTSVIIEDSDEVMVGFEEVLYEFSEPGAGEGVRNVMVCVVLSGGVITSRLRLQARFRDISATVGEDYTVGLDQFTLEPGEMRACVPLTILEDQQLESLEGLVGEIVGVVDSQGGVTPSVDRVTIQPSNTNINIIDMNMVVIGFERSSYNVSEVDGFIDVAVVIINGELSRPVEVTVTTMEGTASDPEDYSFVPRTFTLMTPLSTRQIIRVFIQDDSFDDNDETFELRLSISPDEEDSVQLSPAVATVTIIDDDVFCEDLPALGNGTITYSMVVESPGQHPENTIATYMCDDGFLLMGSQERVCSNNGEYNEMAPTCEPIVCNELEAIANGSISYAPDDQGSEYDLGTVATYSCDDGFVLVGPNETRSCMEVETLGEFSGVAPTCEPIVCNELEAIANGTISYAPDNQGSEYDLGTVATYSCNDGFVLVGPNETRSCVEVETLGEFSGVAPTCEPIVCNELEAIENGAISYAPDNQGSEYDLGTVATYSCNDGFVLVGPNETRSCVEVETLGEFSGVAPTCEPIVCNELEAIANGTISYAPDNQGSEYDLGTVATYSCNDGFVLVGPNETRSCVEVETLGEFSGVAPTCEPIVCNELEAIANGTISYAPDNQGSEYDLGTVATYSCDDGFVLVGPNETRSCMEVETLGEFSGVAPTCEPIVCNELEAIANGTISYALDNQGSEYDLGTVATYSCDDGFVLVGPNETRSCMEVEILGEFSGVAPTCEPIVCNELEAIANGTISYAPDDQGSEYDLGTVATYSCNNGFVLVGPNETRSCMEVETLGEFSGVAPTCEPIVCNELEAIANGTISYAPDNQGSEYDLGTVATYSCNDGFILVGPNETRSCVEVETLGEFSGVAPTCEPIVCNELEAIANGTISYAPDNQGSEYNLGTVATYSCDDVFMLIGSPERTCVSSGNFSGMPPVCSLTPVCGDLPALENGEILYSSDLSPRAVGTVATHICNPGFLLEGVVNRTCAESTEFTDSPPICQPIVCNELEAIENGTISYAPDNQGSEYDLGTVATYSCNDGFVLVGPNETRSCMEVETLGEFNGVAPTCQPIVCNELEAIANGTISYAPDNQGSEYDLGTVATYSCNNGFVLVGPNETRSCVEVETLGEFSGVAPTCEPIVCNELEAIANGTISYAPDDQGSEYDLGTVATYSCNNGFVLVGPNETRSCMEVETLGEFSGVAPTCEPIVCNELEAIANGTISYAPDNQGSEYNLGTVATYSCNDGFVLVGPNETRSCVEVETLGEFSGVAPTCEPIVCNELEAIANGTISYAPDDQGSEYDLGTVATYSCDNGFVLVGPNETRSCMEVETLGEFSGVAPTCEPIVCNELEAIANGTISYAPDDQGSEYDLGTVATYSCNNGFVLVGPNETRSCMEVETLGEFSGVAPTCEPIVCNELEAIANGTISYAPDNQGSEYDLGTVATYSCNDGFVLVGPNETRSCVEVETLGEFSGVAPTCEPIVCNELEAIANGTISYAPDNQGSEYDLGTVAIYSCDDVFMLIGSPERTCVSSGNFSGMPPVCSLTPVCGDLPALENGEILYSSDLSPRAVGTVATHICNPGFLLEGVVNRTCAESTEFTDSPPICQPIVCNELEAIENGTISYAPDNQGSEYDLGTVATYSCNDGFVLVGVNETRSCVEVETLGEFSGVAPTCEPIVCNELEAIANGSISYAPDNQGSEYDLGTVATYSCNDGFVLVGPNETRSCMEVETLGEFSGVAPTCEPIVCNELEAIANGTISYAPDNQGSEYDLGTVATYSCNDGFVLVGPNETRSCMEVETLGEFSGVAPICEPIVCNELQAIANGTISYAPDNQGSEYDLGTVATYSCDDVFMLIGSPERTCVSSGNFSGMPPVCSLTPVCGDLPALENGEILYSSDLSPRAVGTVATHICNPGFLLEGVVNRTCAESTEFTDSPPICQPIVCNELEAIENGTISYAPDNQGSEYNLGTVATYICDDGFVLVGPNQTRSCVEVETLGEFNGVAPICEPIVCNELEAIANGTISYAPDNQGSEYNLGTVATYSCNDGFVLVGPNETRSCVEVETFGEFNGVAPICEPIVCNELEAIANGTISYALDNQGSEYDLGTVATYSCDDGFVLVGPNETRSCVEIETLGEFNGVAPICEPIVCNELEAIANGIISYAPDNQGSEYNLETVATYSCNDGFVLVGPNETRNCVEVETFGEFNGVAPICEPIVCNELEAIANGTISYAPDNQGSEYDLGTVATYSCDDVFMLIGSPERTCVSSGNFSGMPPVCSLTPVCGDLPALENGEILYSSDLSPRAVGTVATHICNPGFLLEGVVNRTCAESTEFTDSPPICQPIVCNELEAIENGAISYAPDNQGSEYNLGTVATYICNDGFVLVGPNETRSCVEVETLGEFNGVAPTCEPIVCNELEAIANGTISYAPDNQGSEYDLGTVATYSCDDGFVLVGPNETRSCMEVETLGEFSGAAPICEPIVCNELEAIANGTISYAPDNQGSEYNLGTVATYSCNDGFVLVGPNETRSCVEVETLGEFSGAAPICEPIVCNELEAIANGTISYAPDNQGSEYDLGTVATYSCDDGFILVGPNETRSCVEIETLGEFSGVAPICEPIVCNELEAIANGTISYAPDNQGSEYNLGTVATYSCNDGFVLVGPNETRSCVEVETFGEFNGVAPICEPIVCNELEAIANGTISYAPDNQGSEYDLGTVATYSCDDVFMLIGSPERTCVSSGNFSGMPPVCSLTPVCGDLPALENGEILYSSDLSPRAVGTIATHTCNPGFLLEGVVNRTCAESTEFTDSPPICQPIVCNELEAIENGAISYAPDNQGSEYNLGTVATYICNDGFVLVGPNETRSCVEVETLGEFSGVAPTCEPIVCNELEAIANGTISYAPDNQGSEYDLGTVATYSCDDGFVLVGPNETRSCMEVETLGEFSGAAPTCEPIVCNELEAIANGIISYAPDNQGPEYDLGTVATYSCDDGFILIGSSNRVCEDDGDILGTFAGIAPSCERVAIEIMFVEPEYTAFEDDMTVVVMVITDRPVETPLSFYVVGGPTDQPNVIPSLPALNRSFVLPINSSLIVIELTLVDDDVSLEPNERVQYRLVLPGGSMGVELGNPNVTYVNIIDDDVTVVELEDQVLTMSEGDITYTTCIVKSSVTAVPVTVEIVDAAGSAESNTDYRSFSPALIVTLDPENNRSCFSGDIIDDLIALEIDENFDLLLRDPLLVSGVLIGQGNRTMVIIIDNDVVTTTLNQPDFRVSENAGAVTLCVTKDLETANPFNVTLTTIDGSATRGVDFFLEEVLLVTLETEAGAITCVDIDIMDDTTFEDVENFRVALSTGSNDTNIQTGEIVESTVLIDDRAPEVPFVNDTIVGDPLLTVPLTNLNLNGLDLGIEGQPSLCFEIHGDSNTYFNLVTDNCVTVNARYHPLNDYWNVINQIGVRAVNEMGQCKNIAVDLDRCTASVDGVALTTNYRSAGIYVRPYRNQVRISVPNCNVSSHLVMYVFCQQNLTVWDPFTDEPFTASMIKYVIAHGLNLNENSHGLIGQFWNVPIEITNYTGPIFNDPETARYQITVTHPDFSGTRSFTGLLSDVNWEFQRTPCFYAGNQQGGPIYEVEEPNDSVIEGEYDSYRVNGPFETDYVFSRFDSNQCR